MSNQKRGLTEEELKMMREMDALFAEMRKHPEITSQPFPDRMDEEVWRDIRAYEAEKAKNAQSAEKIAEESRLTAEEAELIQLGKIYKKRKKNRKLYVLIAALISVMLFGMTSIGENERGFERFNWILAGRPQTNVDSESDNIEKMESVAEEEIYQQIEDEYGFLPVRMTYMPEGIEFIEATLYEEIQTVEMLYRGQRDVSVTYQINVDYRDSSIGTDNKDQLVGEYILEVQDYKVIVKEFYLQEYDETRWLGEFRDANAQYFIKSAGMNRDDFEEILKNLYFF